MTLRSASIAVAAALGERAEQPFSIVSCYPKCKGGIGKKHRMRVRERRKRTADHSEMEEYNAPQQAEHSRARRGEGGPRWP